MRNVDALTLFSFWEEEGGGGVLFNGTWLSMCN